MAHDVFVSYASGDKAVADAVCATLEAHGVRCWIAPRDVLPGIHYGEAIIDAIHECRIMVLVFSSKANLSGHIPKEIERAVSQGITIMPMRIEDVVPAKSLDYFIGSVHWLDAITPPLEVHLQRLAANVKTLLSRDVHAVNPVPRAPIAPAAAALPAMAHATPPAARSSWTSALIAGLTALIVVLALIIYWFNFRGGSAKPQSTMSAPASQPVAQVAPTPATPKAEVGENHSAAPPPIDLKPPKTETVATRAPEKSSAPAPLPPAKKEPAKVSSREVTLSYIPESSIKLEQLIGDEDKQQHQPTPNQTLTRYGIAGAELGYSFEHQGHAYFLFGDTVGRLGRWPDTMAMTDSTDPERGVPLEFPTVNGQFLTISPPGVSMGLSELPVSGISLGGQIYVAISTNFTRGRDEERSVLAKFIPPSTFQPLRTIAQLPGGRLVRMSMHIEPAVIPAMPPGGPFVLMWGTAHYRESDAYLSIVPAAQFETGKGTLYFAGLDSSNKPKWSDNESGALPIVKEGSLGDLSVTWCKDLGLWLMTYDLRRPDPGIMFSYARTPWGPWSDPQLLFNMVRDGGLGKFIHNSFSKRDDGLAGPVPGPRNQVDPASVHGGSFAPYVVERWTKLKDSELNLYYVMSTFNPDVVVLMKSRLHVE
ncbi:MAG: DUF4185 domain-containing protein [Candidatus Acidiferrales bacterium]|jgi:hypothetical protein